MMFPIDQIENRIGLLSERAFDRTAAKLARESAEDSTARADEQRVLRVIDEAEDKRTVSDKITPDDLERVVRSGFAERTDGGVELTALGRYALVGIPQAQAAEPS